MEKLIVIAVIVIGSIIHSWIQRKQDEAADNAAPEPRPPRPQPPNPRPGQRGGPARRPPPSIPGTMTTTGPTGDWQEDLRRLLQGELPGAPTRTESPPVLPTSRAPSAPAAPPRVLARSNIPVPAEGQEMDVGLAVPTVGMQQAEYAHERAQVQSAAARRLHQASAQVSSHAQTPAPPAEVGRAHRARQLLRDRQTQRDAILASIVIGPPRALEPGS